MEDPLEAPPDAQRIAELSKCYRLGGAYIQAYGVGHVHGVVRVGDDPNLRGNPRELNMSHVDDLYAVFSAPGALRDYETPIYLMLSRELLDHTLLDAMSNADPRDPAANMPRLALSHNHAAEMIALEGELFSQIKGKSWMSQEELKAAAERLEVLWAESPLATLLNGHHRIRAVVRLGETIQEDHNRLLSQVRQRTISHEDMRAEMKEMALRAKNAVYRVEVFDSEFEFLITPTPSGLAADTLEWQVPCLKSFSTTSYGTKTPVHKWEWAQARRSGGRPPAGRYMCVTLSGKALLQGLRQLIGHSTCGVRTSESTLPGRCPPFQLCRVAARLLSRVHVLRAIGLERTSFLACLQIRARWRWSWIPEVP